MILDENFRKDLIQKISSGILWEIQRSQIVLVLRKQKRVESRIPFISVQSIREKGEKND